MCHRSSRLAWILWIALALGGGTQLSCDSAPPEAPAPEAPAEAAEEPAPEASPPAESAAAPAVDPNDPEAISKAALAEARRQFQSATDPIDLDVYRVEYVLLLRKELEKAGLPKSALDRMARQELEERAKRKGLID